MIGTLTFIIITSSTPATPVFQTRQASCRHRHLRQTICPSEISNVVVAVCPVGYSNDLLNLAPNLAEGLPVLDDTFVVKGLIEFSILTFFVADFVR